MATKAKGIEDYRNAVKLLKLKVIKLQKQNEELNEKLREQGIPVITDEGRSGPMSNQGVMVIFGRSCKRLGLSPEMLFRACDQTGSGSIKAEDFRLFLSRIRLGLSSPQITLIVRILDEDCSGIIKKEEYYNCLQAYGINEEKSGSTTRTFGQESLMKFAKLLLQNQISVEDSFMKIDQQQKGSVMPLQFSGFVHALDAAGLVTEKEIVAAFNHMDLDKQGIVQQIFYIQEVRKAMKASAQEMGLQGNVLFNQSGAGFNINPSQAATQNPFVKSVVDEAGNEQNQNYNQNQNQQANDQQKQLGNREFNIDMAKSQQTTSKLKTLGVDIIAFLSQLMEKLLFPKAGIMLYDVYHLFKEMYPDKIQLADQLAFFQCLDIGGNGSVDYDELMVFYWEMRTGKEANFDVLFEILTRKLQALDFDIYQYLSLESVSEDSSLDKDQFYAIAKVLFMVQTEVQSAQLFAAMNQEGDCLSAGEIIQAVQKVIDKYNPPKESQEVKMKVAKFDISKLGEYERIMMKLQPTISDHDRFPKFKMKGEGDSLRQDNTQKWRTIFNSDMACLKYCYEQIKEVLKLREKDPKAKWTDPEFGSTPEDEFGSKSMYFADNDIPSGCPDPKEVEWLRPEEIIARLIEDGHEDLKKCEIEVFATGEDGASSNDVCQSKYLGNCWFISALSIIAGYDKYLAGEFAITEESVKELSEDELHGMQIGVCPPMFEFLQQYGMYVCRFYKSFGWRYVLVDDRFAFKDNDYVYGKCRKPNELWVNLIEKSYAKMHGCYFALTSGDISQGLADMSGKVPDKVKLDIFTNESPDKPVNPQEKDKVWNQLLENKQNGTMMGCSAVGDTELYMQMNGMDTGIMSGHAYGIIDVFELKSNDSKNYHKSHRLLKVRNPWGHGEWKLKWSEHPDFIDLKLNKHIDEIRRYEREETERCKQENREPPEPYAIGVDDGTFLMSFKAWRKIFSNLFTCMQILIYLLFKSDFPKEWSGMRGPDSFGPQTSGAPTKIEASQIAYAMKNPQYIMELNRADKKKTELFIQFKQLDGRLFFAEKYPYPNVMKAALMLVFKLGANEKCLAKFDPQKIVASTGKLNLRREIDTDDIELENGRYAIIPCTKSPGEFCKFSVNVYFNCQKNEIKLSKNAQYGDPKFSFQVIEEEEEKFSKVSDDLKKLLKKQAVDYLEANKKK